MEGLAGESDNILHQLTSDTHETEDDVDSDDSENSDDIDKDFYSTRKGGGTAPTPTPHRQSNSPPSSRPVSPTTPSTGVKRRMSMARPAVHHLPGVVVDAKVDSVFLTDLTFMIAEFPIPPSHIHSKEPQQPTLTDFVGMASLKNFAGTWLRSKNDNLRPTEKSQT